MIDQLKKDFVQFAQEKREQYGAMDDTAPMLWDLSVWLNRRLSEIQQEPKEGMYGLTRTLERLSEISGQAITKSKAYTLFGNRGSKPKYARRKAVT